MQKLILKGFEFFANPDNRDEGYITWVADGKRSWHLTQKAAGANPTMQIGDRIIPEEPMSIVSPHHPRTRSQPPSSFSIDAQHSPFPPQEV